MDSIVAQPPALSPEHALSILGEVFYEVVPTSYQTYCIFTARITQRALQLLGMDAKVVPCQVWYASQAGNYVLVFYQTATPQKWNGHAICTADGWLIDAALHHFKKEFGLNVPTIVVKKSFEITSNVISRLDLEADVRIWWHQPPPSLNTPIPEEPADMITDFSNRLVTRIRAEWQKKVMAD